MSGILVCIGQSSSGPLVINHLQKRLSFALVIREEKESRRTFIKRRIKRYGYFKVLGQLLFMAIIPRLLHKAAAPRIKQLLTEYHTTTDTSGVTAPILDVKSMNTPEARDAIKKLKPAVILVIGTGIIRKETLASHNGPWINLHVGLTPLFRGVHGGYWARVERAKFGTTIHYIDMGIDTGEVLFQKEIVYTDSDNFLTYPYVQMTGILFDLERILNTLLLGNSLSMEPIYKHSKIWTHPTIFEYIYYRIVRGIK